MEKPTLSGLAAHNAPATAGVVTSTIEIAARSSLSWDALRRRIKHNSGRAIKADQEDRNVPRQAKAFSVLYFVLEPRLKARKGEVLTVWHASARVWFCVGSVLAR